MRSSSTSASPSPTDDRTREPSHARAGIVAGSAALVVIGAVAGMGASPSTPSTASEANVARPQLDTQAGTSNGRASTTGSAADLAAAGSTTSRSARSTGRTSRSRPRTAGRGRSPSGARRRSPRPARRSRSAISPSATRSASARNAQTDGTLHDHGDQGRPAADRWRGDRRCGQHHHRHRQGWDDRHDPRRRRHHVRGRRHDRQGVVRHRGRRLRHRRRHAARPTVRSMPTRSTAGMRGPRIGSGPGGASTRRGSRTPPRPRRRPPAAS